MIYNGSDSLSSDSGTSRSGHQSWYVFHISHFGCKYSTFLNISIIFGENLWFWPGRRKIRRYWPLIFSVRIKPGISDYMERLSVLTRWNLSISMSIVRNIMSIRRPLFSEIVSSVQWWKSLIKIILVFSNELAKSAKIFAKKFGGLIQTAYLCGPFWEEHIRREGNEKLIEIMKNKYNL